MPARLKIDDNLIINEYLSGKTCYEVAKEFCCGFKTVLRRLHENNVKIRERGIKKITAKDISQIIEEYKAGETDVIKLGLKYHVHYSIISNILKNNNIPTKERKKKVVITPEQELEIVDLYTNKRLSFRQICLRYCNHNERIIEILEKHGVKYIPLNHSTLPEELKNKIVSMYINDKTASTQIAKMLNIPHQRVRKLLISLNLMRSKNENFWIKYPKELTKEIIDMNHNQNKTIMEIEEITGLDWGVITRIIRKSGLDVKLNGDTSPKFDLKGELKIVKHYEKFKNILKASRDFECEQNSVTRILKKHNVYEATERYKYNEEYFDKINSHEKAYILGMLITDGCNQPNNGNFCLKLKSDDYEIVTNIVNQFSENRPVIYNLDKERRKYVSFSVNSRKMSEKLEELGLPQNKTFKIKPENWMTGEFSNSAILGMMDGDGSIYKRERLQRNRKTMDISWTFSFIGTKCICEMMRTIFKEKLNINSSVCHASGYKDNLEKPLCTVRVYGNRQVKILLDWLYKDSKLRMRRKHNRYLELCKHLAAITSKNLKCS